MELETTKKRLERFSRFGALLGGLGMLFIAGMITVDVLLRKFLHTTLGGATEVAGFIFAVGTAMSYPFVLFERANIRIDVLYSQLSTRIRSVLDVCGMLAVLYFVSVLTVSVVKLAIKSWHANSESIGVITIPIWIPQFFWSAGFILFALSAAFLTLFAVSKLFRGQFEAVNKVIGVPSISETIEEETYIEAEDANDGDSSNSDGRRN